MYTKLGLSGTPSPTAYSESVLFKGRATSLSAMGAPRLLLGELYFGGGAYAAVGGGGIMPLIYHHAHHNKAM